MGALDTPENKPHKRELCPYQVCQDPFATTWVHCATCAQAYHQQCAHHDAADEPFTCDRCAHKRRRPRLSSLELAGALLPRAALAPVATTTTTTPQSEGSGQRKREAPVALLALRREAKPPLPPWLRPHEPLFGWEWREVVIALATQYGKQVEPHPAKVARAQSDLGAFYQQLCNANISETTNKGLKKTVYDLLALSRSPRSHRAIVEILKLINPEIIEDYLAFYEACVAIGVANVPPPQAPGAEWAPPVTSPKLEPAAIVTKRPHTSNSETTSETTSSSSSSSSSLLLSKRPRFDHPSPVLEVEDGELLLKPTMAPWEFQVLAFALAAQYNVDTRSSPEWERRVAADPDECLEFMYQMSLVLPHQELTLLTYTGSYMDTQLPRPFEKWRQLGRRLTPVVVPFYLAYYRVCVEHSIEPKMLI